MRAGRCKLTDGIRVIFLDIDGVLNSAVYDRERTDKDGNIDVSRLVLLKQIVDAANAQIVLSSSWREHWEPEDEKCDQIGKELNCVFRGAGLCIADKTPMTGSRQKEISSWLDAHPYTADYVILDDAFGGWGDLEPHLVKTNSRIGRGLEDRHVEAAVKILNRII